MLSKKQATAFIFLEVLLALIIVLQVKNIVKALLGTNFVSFLSFESTLFDSAILLFLAVFLLSIGQIVVVKKDKTVAEVHKGFSKIILGSAKRKILGIRTEIIVLWIAEFAFASVIAMSIYVYLDPEVNIVPFPYNFIGFLGLLTFGMIIFSHTKPFRRAVYGQGFLQSKIRPARQSGKKAAPRPKKKKRIAKKRRK
ncbi:MAG: hypothetical protein NTZ73_02235 [Candidatus Diapherotrites archaeon]|nr:hypothetical protein [Candidatus Diapherotrites archaeon]